MPQEHPETFSTDVPGTALRPYASRIELFGSEARGEAQAHSDIDVLVKLRLEEERPPLGYHPYRRKIIIPPDLRAVRHLEADAVSLRRARWRAPAISARRPQAICADG